VERCLACEADVVETLEGSRLSARLVTTWFFVVSRGRPENVKAGGSHELPSVCLLSRARKETYLPNRAVVQKIALGYSREPPVATRFGCTNDRNNEAGSSHARQSGSLHGSDRIGLASEAALQGSDRFCSF
jgi:hypothetical protein